MTVENISIDVKTNAGNAAKQFKSLSDAMNGVKQAAGAVSGATISMGDVSGAASNAAKAVRSVSKAASEIKPISVDMQGVISTASQVEVLEAKLESLQESMQRAFDAGDMDKAYQIRGQIIQTEAALERATAAAEKNAQATEEVGKAAKSSTGAMGKLFSSIKRIAMYRMLRTALKEVGQAFQEGLKNAYHFSKGIGGTLAESLDSIATKSLTMKNQLGAAFGNLLTVLTPILLQIINLVRQAAQAISALFSALGGGDYLIATDVAQEWDKATGAAKKYKNTILGFDEINRLDDETGGGGGNASDFAKMFEKGELPAWAQWIKDHLEEIKKLAVAIGLAFAAWKIGSLLGDLAGVALSMSQLLGIAMAVAGAFLLFDGALDAFKNGTTWENVNEMLIGTSLLAGGLALAFGSVGAAVGLLVGGVTLIATALTDFIKKGELTSESLYALEGGILAVGAGLALLTGSWIPLAIAGLAGLVLAIGTHTEEINTAIDGFFANIIPSIDGFLKRIEETTGLDLTKIREKVIYALNFIRFAIEADVIKIGWLVEDLGRVVKAVADGDWNAAWSAMKDLAHDVSLDVSKDIASMAESVTKDMMDGKASTDDLSKSFAELMETARTSTPEAKAEFSGFTDSVVDGVNKAQTPLQNFLDKLTSILSKLQEIAGISVTGGGLLGLLSGNGWNFSLKETLGISAHAAGGEFTNDGTLFVAGEAGAEVVADLGGKTGVMNVQQMEAAVANGNINVINAIYGMANMIVKAVESIDPDITLDGESLADKMYRYNQNAANRHGVAMVTG